MNTISIAPNLSLPLDIVTQTIALLAKRRAGKSYTARRIVEQVHKAGQQVIIVDPKGDWWGIRSAADGRAAGLPITILGGEHGDLPLLASSGEIVAHIAVEQSVSLLLDLGQFRKHEIATFMATFLETVYRLKAQERYRTPVLLAIDEADAIAPQKPFKGEERMLGAAEDIVRRGGQRGIGCLMACQRSSVLNKNVLTQTEVMVALRTISPQDTEAMDAWIEKHGDAEKRRVLMSSLPALPVGDAWFWSPGWPTEQGIFSRVHVYPIETFDSGATPKAGEKRSQPKTIASVDLDELRAQMAETIERAKADDPKELRKRIAELERTKRPAVQAFNPEEIRDAERRGYSSGRQSLQNELINVRTTIRSAIGLLNQKEIDIDRCLEAESHSVHDPPPIRKPVSQTADIPVPKVAPIPRGGLTGPEQRILDAIAWMVSIGVEQPEVTAVAFLAGYTIGGGAFNNPKSSLRSKGLLDYSGNQLFLTPSGRSLANRPGSAPTTEELQRRVMERLPNPEIKILRVALEAYPRSITKEQCAILAGYEPGGGAFNNPKSRLRTLGLIEYPKAGEIRARDILFVGGRH